MSWPEENTKASHQTCHLRLTRLDTFFLLLFLQHYQYFIPAALQQHQFQSGWSSGEKEEKDLVKGMMNQGSENKKSFHLAASGWNSGTEARVEARLVAEEPHEDTCATSSRAFPPRVTFKRFRANERRSFQGCRRCLKPNSFVFTSQSRWHASKKFRTWRLVIPPSVHLLSALLLHVDTIGSSRAPLLWAQNQVCRVNGKDGWRHFFRNVIFCRQDFRKDYLTCTSTYRLFSCCYCPTMHLSIFFTRDS